jgi:hypothetical protein
MPNNPFKPQANSSFEMYVTEVLARLDERQEVIHSELQSQNIKIEKLEDRVDGIEKKATYVSGIVVGLSILIGLAEGWIRRMFLGGH